MATLGGSRTGTGRGALKPFAVLFGLSLLLLMTRNTDVVRSTAAVGTAALVPFQRVLSDTGSAVGRVGQAIGEIDQLRRDNAGLRSENDRLTLENARLAEQAASAMQAAGLDAAARGLPYESIAATVIARDPSSVMESLVIGSGIDQGVAVNQVVVSDQGLVGRISEVGAGYAKVLLVTDSASTISAIVQGSRATGIVRGQYGDTLVMDWILQSEPVRVGDVVVTAGLGLGDELRSLYPKGLVLGRVVAVDRAPNSAYLRAIIQPAIDLSKLEQVLVARDTK